MSTPSPRRSGGRTHLELAPDQLVWAIYGRESFDRKGTAEQVNNQLADMRAYVATIGGKVGREYPENNVSAFKRVRVELPDGTTGYRVVRPDWDAMMTALRRGAFNALCVPNIDRGMRDPRDLEDLIDLVERHGVYVVGLTGNLDLTTDAGISSARNEVNQRNQESRNISRRVQSGNRAVALKGLPHKGGRRPFGWRKDQIHVNRREAMHILREVPRIIAGVRATTIAREWNERGVPTVSGTARWTDSTIRQVFTNPRLCAWRVYHAEILKDADGLPVLGQWEPILSADQYEAIISVLGPSHSVLPQNFSNRRPRAKFLLTPFLRCGKCKGKMHGAQWYNPRGKLVFYYRCKPKGAGGCGSVSRVGGPLDLHVTELVLAEQSRLRFAALPRELPPWPKTGELEVVREQISEATENYVKQRISGSRFYPLLAALEAEEKALSSDQRNYEARQQEHRTFALPDLRARWASGKLTLEEKQAIIAKSIVAIVVNPARAQGVRFDPSSIEIVWNQSS